MDGKEKRLKNLKSFPKAPQGLNDKKSDGQIERAKNNNILLTARSLFQQAGILPDLVENIKEEVLGGNNKNAIDFLKIIKENEVQEHKLTPESFIQKVYITPEQQQETDKHIDDIIK